VVLSAGTFALVEAYDYPYRLGIQYRFAARGRWSLEPGLGAAFGPDGMAFLYLDLLRDFQLGERWLLTPSLAAGYFANGDEIGVRDHQRARVARQCGHQPQLQVGRPARGGEEREDCEDQLENDHEPHAQAQPRGWRPLRGCNNSHHESRHSDRESGRRDRQQHPGVHQ
jgi:hypothetical protein